MIKQVFESTMSPRIGLIVSSQRRVRICPQVANFVQETIQASLTTTTAKPLLHQIDLAAWNLPIFDETVIPQKIQDPSGYDHEHTRAWSREIASHDAFIFVSPQYNGGYPASLKNAIDYLFNEWKGKPTMIVTYGGRGGGLCGAQIEGVMTLMGMKPIGRRVELSYPDMEFAVKKAFPGQDLGLDAASQDSVWASEKPNIIAAFKELEAALSTQPNGA